MRYSELETVPPRARDQAHVIAEAQGLIIAGIKGVCCSCQTGHPVMAASRCVKEDDNFFYGLDDDAEGYVMARDSMFADIYAHPEIPTENADLYMCDGIGTMPQAVYEPKN